MEQQGVELRSVIARRADDKTWSLTITLEIMTGSELEAIGWLVSMLEGER